MNPEFATRLAALGWNSAEVEESFVRGSGRGGQKINKTSSCVTLHHRPTGLLVRCQRERSQATNRELAWEELCAKLAARQRAAAAATVATHELARRRTRQKNRRQKGRMIAAKKHRAGIKDTRGRVASD